MVAAAAYARVEGGIVRECPTVLDGFALAECYPAAFVAACVEVPAALASQVAQGWAWDGATFAPPAEIGPGPPAPITALEFIGRFTPIEQVAVWTAAMRSPALLGFVVQLAAAGSVHLDDPRMVAGVALLADAGLVAPSRPAEVLSTAAADAVTFDTAGAVESGPVRADAVTFDIARAVEADAPRADAVAFAAERASESPTP